MHSLIDIFGGPGIGFGILYLWLAVHEYIDNFLDSGQNVTSFWASQVCCSYGHQTNVGGHLEGSPLFTSINNATTSFIVGLSVGEEFTQSIAILSV
ncbi:hypothetical protein SLEP1_g6997 [Rubroshorea leprosula]|uniref:Uncharacterized protein n=1 Tax=Rubroshorea leprosula TaxID=152421 RepID=A0AAV5I606_9ROSI|nr:hypothetical protein SLEP1_g6997 [Rubroshorea leprosula]